MPFTNKSSPIVALPLKLVTLTNGFGLFKNNLALSSRALLATRAAVKVICVALSTDAITPTTL